MAENLNKAQQAVVNDFYEDYEYSGYLNLPQLNWFAKKLLAIDDTPDLETYCIEIKEVGHRTSVKYSGLTKAASINKLYELMAAMFSGAVIEYKRGEYLLLFSGARYEVRLEE